MHWLVERVLPPGAQDVGAGRLPAVGIQRILVTRPNHRLGNAVLMTPLVAALEAQYPGAEIDVLGAGAATAQVFSGYGAIGRVHLIHQRALRHPVGTFKVLRAIRGRSYDLVIDAATGSSSGRIVATLARARFRLRASAPGSLVPPHLAARPVHALRWALGGVLDAPLPPLDLRMSDDERRAGRQALERVLAAGPRSDARVLAVFPNATGRKRFGTAWWKQFLEALTVQLGPMRVVELIAADGKSRVDDQYPAYFTSDIRKLAAFIEAAGTYVSADCGVMHLAAATRAATVGLFSTTDPKRYAPYGEANAGISPADGDPLVAARRVADHLRRVWHDGAHVTNALP
ncbi:ADP-heptose:LPS heptosyltransferase [Luteibacter sp. UNC138MFCol5.1]|uniref:glycosyltransferase family 9 protein n=1 Tax=Luteibacter sp. UNC138MFCol5.1 TaxID=1502774 RepID=UPI0008BB69C6|nr:glycosyltransferase family 9 protein [Luteibacter sp. UNC138MFCol5.1]SEO66200.1 ADP-heptose:LPS heptosyltransferase [Luteibacter sp. UNC138MFCol5.1]